MAAPYRDVAGRDRFGGGDPEALAAPASLTDDAPRSLRQFLRAHRRAVVTLLTVVAVGVFVLVVLPQIADLGDALDRLQRGNRTWLAVGIASEALSIGGYIAIFRAVFSCEGTRIGWRASSEITLAGLVATKFFAAAGAGGIALTVWALRASGLSGRIVARRMAAFEILLYSVYMSALVVVGTGLAVGILPGSAPLAMSAIPAAFGGAVIMLALAMRLVPADLEARVLSRSSGGRLGRLLARLATIPHTLHEGMVTAIALLRHPSPWLLGAVAYWAFDIGALWAAFHAFGASPAIPILILGYFVGLLANTIPIPGGVGGVEGGMIGAFIALGVDGGDAVLAVLSYRFISYWLPLLPGTLAYFRLRATVASWREDPRQEASSGSGLRATAPG